MELCFRISVGILKLTSVLSDITVPKVRAFNVIISNVAATVANISWDWDKTWLEEQGKMDNIHGELRGFKVSVDYLSSLVSGQQGWSRQLLIYPGTGTRPG